MQLKLFVLPLKNLAEAEAEMNAFLRSRRVLAVKKEFVPDGENSFWTFCVEYLDAVRTGTGSSGLGGKPPKVDYKEVLKPEEFEVFSRLREWRKGVAEQEGVPVYAVLTNDLKGNTAINRTAFGMDFLGYRLFPEVLRLARRSKRRFARKFRRYEATYAADQWSELVLQQRMTALLAFVTPAESLALRRHVMQRFGVVANRLEPCESRRQLEQQRDQLPGGEPQQQQPDQPQQQYRVPRRPAPSSTRPPQGGGADPVAILSPAGVLPAQRSNPKPPGASRLAEPAENSGRPGSTCGTDRKHSFWTFGAKAMDWYA